MAASDRKLCWNGRTLPRRAVAIAAALVTLAAVPNRGSGEDGAAMVDVVEAPAADISVASLPPSVVSTVPRCGDTAVPPDLTEVGVTFSKDMKVTGHCWSWCGVRDDTFPELSAPTRFLDDKRTCVMTVALQPEKTYAIWINTEEYHSFQDPDGHTAVPYLLVFRTGAAE